MTWAQEHRPMVLFVGGCVAFIVALTIWNYIRQIYEAHEKNKRDAEIRQMREMHHRTKSTKSK